MSRRQPSRRSRLCVESRCLQLSGELYLPPAGPIKLDVREPGNVGGRHHVGFIEHGDTLASKLAEEEPKLEDDVLASTEFDGALPDRVRFVVAGQEHDRVLRTCSALLELLDEGPPPVGLFVEDDYLTLVGEHSPKEASNFFTSARLGAVDEKHGVAAKLLLGGAWRASGRSSYVVVGDFAEVAAKRIRGRTQ